MWPTFVIWKLQRRTYNSFAIATHPKLQTKESTWSPEEQNMPLRFCKCGFQYQVGCDNALLKSLWFFSCTDWILIIFDLCQWIEKQNKWCYVIGTVYRFNRLLILHVSRTSTKWKNKKQPPTSKKTKQAVFWLTLKISLNICPRRLKHIDIDRFFFFVLLSDLPSYLHALNQ